uniref:Putative secreted protein n=1 Tax=Rhipicephalus microplus TaxID=6941 RepID=A0A6M2DB76_RHIMP
MSRLGGLRSLCFSNFVLIWWSLCPSQHCLSHLARASSVSETILQIPLTRGQGVLSSPIHLLIPALCILLENASCRKAHHCDLLCVRILLDARDSG